MSDRYTRRGLPASLALLMLGRELDLPSRLNECGYLLDVTLPDGTKQTLNVEQAERLLDAQRNPAIDKPDTREPMRDFAEALIGFSPSRGTRCIPVADPLSNFAHLSGPRTSTRRVGGD